MSDQTRERRKAVRSSRPDSVRWLTVMVVLSHRTFRFSITTRRMLWILGGVAFLWAFFVVGGGYGLWATKKIMSFSHLRTETQAQQSQLKGSLEEARKLEDEVAALRKQHEELLRLLDPKAPAPDLPPAPPKVDPNSKAKVSQLQQEMETASQQAALIRARMQPIVEAWTHTPSVMPTAGYFSSGFGRRINPFTKGGEEESLLSFHSGLDISNAMGTPIQATADGEVEDAGWMEHYGNAVVLRHNDEFETLYGHMSRILVKPGQKIARGDLVGEMGSTGRSTGVHLHYEVRKNGKPIDPRPYLKLQRQWLSGLLG